MTPISEARAVVDWVFQHIDATHFNGSKAAEFGRLLANLENALAAEIHEHYREEYIADDRRMVVEVAYLRICESLGVPRINHKREMNKRFGKNGAQTNQKRNC